MDKRIDLILELREKRMTYTKIGKLLGVSRQRIHQIVKRPSYLNKKSPITRIPENWEPSNKLSTTGIKMEGLDRIREAVRRRDGYMCQICLIRWSGLGRRLDVHHLDPELEGRSNKKGAYALDKKNTHRMITLCHKCHLRLHHLRDKMGPKNK